MDGITSIITIVLVIVAVLLAIKQFSKGRRSLRAIREAATQVYASDAAEQEMVLKALSDISNNPIQDITQSIIALVLVLGCLAIVAFVPAVPRDAMLAVLGVVVGYYFRGDKAAR